MGKINKVYPSFYNGMSEQIPELVPDSQCPDMVNCVPNIVTGLSKRPPCSLDNVTIPDASNKLTLIHSYDRGEGDEKYIIYATGDVNKPLIITDENNISKTVNYEGSVNLSVYQEYLIPEKLSNLKAITVQDRTFIANNEKTIETATILNEITTTMSYHIEVDINNILVKSVPYLGGHRARGRLKIVSSYGSHTFTRYSANMDSGMTSKEFTVDLTALTKELLRREFIGYDGKRLLTDYEPLNEATAFDVFWVPETTYGHNGTMISKSLEIGQPYERSNTLGNVAYLWIKRASGDELTPWRYSVYLNSSIVESVYHETDAVTADLVNKINALAGYSAEDFGSFLRITSTSGDAFQYATWDSWGSQASFSWRRSVKKLSELPDEIPIEGVIVEITGDESTDFDSYWVVSRNGVWVETVSPLDERGVFINMPLIIDRKSDGTFMVQTADWNYPLVGDYDTNPTPSFVGKQINSLFFYKNRLGLTTGDSIVLSESGGYYNFYAKTAIEIVDTDPIDIALASITTSVIHYAIPFQGSLMLFTEEAQYEMRSDAITTPTSVFLESVSNYPMNVKVAPKVSGNKLYFISTTGEKNQLREYRKDANTYSAVGVDLTIGNPNLLTGNLNHILINAVLGYIFVTNGTEDVYLYNFKENNNERVQSAWSKWKLFTSPDPIPNTDISYLIFDNKVHYHIKVNGQIDAYTCNLITDSSTKFIDDNTSPYTAKIKLPTWYPHFPNSELGSPTDKILLKKLTIEGEGSFDATLYFKDYDTTYTKHHSDTSLQDLDIHINAKTNKVDVFVEDSSYQDFTIRSFIFEGLHSSTSKEQK